MVTTATVPGLRQVGINGIGFIIDDQKGRGVKRRSVPFLRNQADTGAQVGAQSLNPAGVWRRSQEDWSHGAGQSHRDREDSDPARFRSSKGINVWDKWKLSLLPDTENVRALGNSNTAGKLVVSENTLFVSDSFDVFWTQDLVTWTALNINAGETLRSPVDLTTDGRNVYAAQGFNGIHRYTGVGSPTHYSDVEATSVRWIKGRLMAGAQDKLYNVTAGGAAPTPLYTHRLPTWSWTAFAEGPSHIYAAGSNPYGLSEIYKTTIQPDGTALGAPSLAAPALPANEQVQVMLGVAGHVVVGTNLGIHLAEIDAGGNLNLGPAIPVPTSSLAAIDRFVYFGWSLETGLRGLGRLDLSRFNAPLQPAYASDLMAVGTTQALGIVEFNGRIVFGIAGGGGATNGSVWASHPTNKVASGTLDTGDISFGITDDKVATLLDVAHEPLVGSHGASLAVNGSAFSSLGTHTEGGSEGPFTVPESKGERFEVRHTLSRNGAGTAGPTVTRSTLSAYPVPRRPSEVFEVWLLLHTAESLNNGNTESRDPHDLLTDIIELERNGTVIDFQLGAQSYRALIEDHQFESESEPLGAWPEGSVGLTVRAI